MKKQVAVRFNHPTFSQETIEKMGLTEKTFVKHQKEPGTFDIIIDDAMQFEAFADDVEKETGIKPIWTSVFSVDIKDNNTNNNQTAA